MPETTTLGELMDRLDRNENLGKEHIEKVLAETEYTSPFGSAPTKFASPEVSLIHWLTMSLRAEANVQAQINPGSYRVKYFNQVSDAIDSRYGFDTKTESSLMIKDIDRQLNKAATQFIPNNNKVVN